MVIDKWKKSIPKELVKSLASNDQPIFFIGAGFGKEAVPPLRTGGELAEEMRAELSVDDNGEGLSELLQYYQNDKASNKIETVRWLEEKLLYLNSSPGGSHRLLLELPIKEILTTNYDSLLVDASREIQDYHLIPAYDATTYKNNLYHLLERKGAVLGYLHGAFTEIKKIVATTDDYVTSYTARSQWDDLLRKYLTDRKVVFIGYSLRDFTTWTSYISVFSKYKGEIQHTLVSPLESKHIEEFWKNYGIKYIPLKAYQFLIAIHDSLDNLEHKSHIAIAAAASCLGKTYTETLKYLEENYYDKYDGPNAASVAAIRDAEESKK